MAKIYSKKGFEYYSERNSFYGHWVITWYYKPEDEKLFLPFTAIYPDKALKADLEKLLNDPIAATAQYKKQLSRAVDVEFWKKELKKAEERWEKVSSPDYGSIRGSNPNKDSRVWENARTALNTVKYSLERAVKYRAILASPD